MLRAPKLLISVTWWFHVAHEHLASCIGQPHGPRHVARDCFLQPYHVTLRRWLMSRLPSFGSFAVSKGVSPLQSFSRSCLKCHGCIGGGTRSLASCITCPTCLRTAFMLRSSGTTLLMPRNTPHTATGLVALSSSTAALAWSRRFRLLA